MQNTDHIINLERSNDLLAQAAAQAKSLAADKTPMPDRVGTVQSRYNAAVAAQEMHWLQLLAASNLQPPALVSHQPPLQVPLPPIVPIPHVPLNPVTPLTMNTVVAPVNPASLRPYPDPTPAHYRKTAGLMT
jgi:hypothetical protein